MNKLLIYIISLLLDNPNELEVKLSNYLLKHKNIQDVLVLKDENFVFVFHREGNPIQVEINSITKSIISILIGIAIDKKYISNVNEKLLYFFPEIHTRAMDERVRQISIKDLLMMSSGFPYKFGELAHQNFKSERDPFVSACTSKLIFEPGNEFNYNEYDPHCLSALLSKVSGISTLAFAKKHLFDPLEIKDVTWTQDSQNRYYGGIGLSLSANDLMKIGLTCIKRGIYNEKKVFSSDWLNSATKLHKNGGPPLGTGYGLYWWISSVSGYHAYFAYGAGDKILFIVPELNLVIVILTNNEFS
ncbi:serine hydrolase [Paenibacillus polysaccharolyticus]|uniref:serine hydrolase domain-containing protein n=1 Tax=Paenibacillus polysaccharolyticus TaxID=582692 RepID=UPI00203A7E5E|nr:serine hydrolase [Paenibacillus polysaccharolyticus]MCM3135813.1 serine hydrolase [Paenibacillus polysaccharolyticus]